MIQTLFKTQVGSFTYGTNIGTSDIDYKGICFDHGKTIVDYFFKDFRDEIEHTKDDKDYTLYKLKSMLDVGNQTAVEMLFTDEKFFTVKDPILDVLFDNKEIYISRDTVLGYLGSAMSQLNKAKGINKKMNFTEDEKIRKHPIDFCQYTHNGKTYKLTDYLRYNYLNQEDLTFNKIDGIPYGLCLYDHKSKGLFGDDSNEPRYAEVPKGSKPLLQFVWFNQQAYSKHCRSYREYLDWKENHNPTRYVKTAKNQTIDGKNMMHAVRMVESAMEILTTGKVKVMRPNREELLDIRFGKVDLVELHENMSNKIIEIRTMSSDTIPSNVNKEKSNEIFFEIYRKLLKFGFVQIALVDGL